MASATGKDLSFAADLSNTTATLTSITSHITNVSLSADLSALQDTALGDGEHTYVPGVAGSTVDVTGLWNSTTETIYGSLVGTRTSVTKTIEWKTQNLIFFTGEAIVTNVGLSGAVDTVSTFTASHQITGAMTKTTVTAIA